MTWGTDEWSALANGIVAAGTLAAVVFSVVTASRAREDARQARGDTEEAHRETLAAHEQALAIERAASERQERERIYARAERQAIGVRIETAWMPWPDEGLESIGRDAQFNHVRATVLNRTSEEITDIDVRMEEDSGGWVSVRMLDELYADLPGGKWTSEDDGVAWTLNHLSAGRRQSFYTWDRGQPLRVAGRTPNSPLPFVLDSTDAYRDRWRLWPDGTMRLLNPRDVDVL